LVLTVGFNNHWIPSSKQRHTPREENCLNKARAIT
jgi:hypothetical protein